MTSRSATRSRCSPRAGRHTYKLVGIFGYSGDRDSFGGETRVAFTKPVAQQVMLGRPGYFNGVDVQAADGVTSAS